MPASVRKAAACYYWKASLTGMAFPDDYLNPGEDLILNLKPHWWVFAKPGALLAAALAVSIALTFWDVQYVSLIGWGLLAATVVNTAVAFGRWSTTHFVVSSERLIFRHGLLTKRGVQLPIDRINNINFKQSVLERMIGAGDLLIESAGESGQSLFSNVRKPSAVQNEIYRQIDLQRDRLAGGRPSSDQSSADLIRDLEDLREQGLVTPEEFEAKRQDLLDRM